jgi:hypothetical protein
MSNEQQLQARTGLEYHLHIITALLVLTFGVCVDVCLCREESPQLTVWSP